MEETAVGFNWEIVIQDMDDYHEIFALLKREKQQSDHLHEATGSSASDLIFLDRHVAYLEGLLIGWMRKHSDLEAQILFAQGV